MASGVGWQAESACRPLPPLLQGSPVRHTGVCRDFLALWLCIWAGFSRPGVAQAPALRLETAAGVVALKTSTPLPTPGMLLVFSAPNVELLAWNPTEAFVATTPRMAGGGVATLEGIGEHPARYFRGVLATGILPWLRRVESGTFRMGSPASESGRTVAEGPTTWVNLPRPLLMGRFEVTQAEYLAVMGQNPSYFTGITNRPVENVNWSDAMEYCRRLTDAQRAGGILPAGWAYRLPTEAEWEWACRAGSAEAFGTGASLQTGDANFDGRYPYEASRGVTYEPRGTILWRTTAVGAFPPNAWGLHDLHGNVWEWCLDPWKPNLPGGTVTDPSGPPTGSQRAVRGGAWYSSGDGCRSATRIPLPSDFRGNDVGFRVVLGPVRP